MTIIRALGLAALLIVVSLTTLANNSPQQLLLQGEDVDEFKYPVSIARLPSGNLLVANYHHVFLVNPGSLDVKILTPRLLAEVKEFVPTGLAVSGERVFIANYTGNNVLEATIDEGRGTLTVIDTISVPTTRSPEGVAFDGADTLGAANYDGNTVQLFKRAGEGWDLSCELEIQHAHGIAFAKDQFFASSLERGTIYRIDPVRCAITGSIGTKGWKPGQFLWPTSISTMPDGNLVVSDAHTGLMTVLDPEHLSIIRSFGGNGPGETGFNMPYGVSGDGPVWVTSTFGHRLAQLNNRGETVRVLSASAAPQWDRSFPQRAFLNGQDYAGYNSPTTLTIDGNCYHPSYASLAPCAEGTPIEFKMIQGNYFYFAQAAKGARGTFVTSPENEFALYFRDGQKPTEVRIGFDVWQVGNRLVGPAGSIDLDSIEPH